MDDRHRSSNDEHLAVAGAIGTSEPLLAAFSRTSAIGFAILDEKLRYQAINSCLAGINGIPREAHLEASTRELFGELSQRTAEPSYRRVLAEGESARFEVKNAVLPGRAASRYWGLNINFPIRDRAGRVRQIGMMVVEVTTQRKLEQYLCTVADKALCRRPLEMFQHARELQEALEQYHAALALGLDVLRRPKSSSELMAESVQRLDQRILAMRNFVAEAASRFPIEA